MEKAPEGRLPHGNGAVQHDGLPGESKFTEDL